ncbi:MAG: hypothetical protein B6D55_04645 [Candidatus Omnitrophica bacterium 4484_70.2]|nr:MAG: hypothetical protein B6D55_04645 [Candidatus Omnitrophica bacterium 4484_70.2]
MLRFRDEGYAIVAVDKKRKIYIEITPFAGFFIPGGKVYGFLVFYSKEKDPHNFFFGHFECLIEAVNRVDPENNLKEFKEILKERVKKLESFWQEDKNRDLV